MTTAAAGALVPTPQARAQPKLLQIGEKAVELTLAPVTAQTVRITIQPFEAVPQDGALVKEDFGRPAARLRALDARIVKCGDPSVRVSAIHSRCASQARAVA